MKKHLHLRFDVLALMAFGLFVGVATLGAALVYDSWLRDPGVFAPIQVDLAIGATGADGQEVNISACNNGRRNIGGFLISSWQDAAGEEQGGGPIVVGAIAPGCTASSLTVEGDGWRAFVFGFAVGPRSESQVIFEVLGDE